MKKIILLLAFLSALYCFYGCRDEYALYQVVVPEETCTVEHAENGAIISCPDGTEEIILNGVDGLNGKDNIIEIIDPCGDGDGFDEILIRLSDNTLICYFQEGDKKFLSILTAGNYVTTDSQACYFTVTEDLEVIDEF